LLHPPRLVLVPPPASRRKNPWLVWACGGIAASLLAVAAYFSDPRGMGLPCVYAAILFGTPLFAGTMIGLERRARRRRVEFLRAHRQAVRDPLSRAMQRVWKPGGPPSIRRVKRELARLGIEEPETTLVISFGASPTCEIGEHRFEPVVRRRRVVGWLGLVMCVQFGVLLLPMIYLASVVPRTALPPSAIGSFALIGGLFALSLSATVWEVLSPSFTRIAPRYLDFTRFTFRSKPTSIMRFPLEAAARVFVVGRASMRVESNGRSKSVSFAGLGRVAEINEVVWKCLLSTAKAPPLSEEGLSG
jgi:hypothetical protein